MTLDDGVAMHIQRAAPSLQACAAQDGTDSLISTFQHAVVSPKNVITNGLLGGDATISTSGGPQARRTRRCGTNPCIVSLP